MASLTKSTSPHIPIFFNVDQRVGQGCPNLPEDVALVTYLMRMSAKGAGPKNRAILQNTTITSTWTPALSQSIKDFQAINKWEADGRVSPSSPNGAHSKGPYTIFALNTYARTDYPDIWPRMDRAPGMPMSPQIIALVQRVLLGGGQYI